MKKIIITVFAFLVLFGFTITGAMAQAWTWDDPIEITTKVKEISGDPKSDAIYGIIDATGAVGLLTTGDSTDGIPKTGAPAVAIANDLVVGYGGFVYTIDDDNLGVLNEDPNPLKDQQPSTPNGLTGKYTHIASGNNGKLYVVFETEDQQYLLVGNPPVTIITADAKITPRSLNLGSKGRWVSCRISNLSGGFTVGDIDPATVCIKAINGEDLTTAVCRDPGSPMQSNDSLMIKFLRSDVISAIPTDATSAEITVTGSGITKDGESFEFTGNDTIKTKPAKIPKPKKK